MGEPYGRVVGMYVSMREITVSIPRVDSKTFLEGRVRFLVQSGPKSSNHPTNLLTRGG